MSPVERGLGQVTSARFFGDAPDRPHTILWDKAMYLSGIGGRLPSPTERVPLVVVGGGMSGLMTAYLLRAYQPIVLEQAARFGGNSQGQSWQGIDYSIGAAYFVEPENGTPLRGLLTELGIPRLWTIKSGEDPVALAGKIYPTLWDGDTSAADKRQFRALSGYLRAMHQGKGGLVYPEIPITDLQQASYIKTLDRLSFRQHLEAIAGGSLHPHIDTAIEHYCWSSLGGSAAEVSAAAGLNFYLAEFGNIAILPGGNAAVAERLLDRLLAVLPSTHLRPSALVFDVEVVPDGVIVAYTDAQQRARCIHAQAVVLCCPKFVVARILRDIDVERAAAIARIRYRSYLVANVLLKQGLQAKFYGLYLLGDGTIDSTDIRAAAQRQQVTDVVLANYVHPDPDHSVLTLYRGLPYDGARADLYAAGSYERYRSLFERQIAETILPLLGLSQEHVVDLRIARWGHPLPLAATGLITDGTIDLIRTPFRERVFFVEQDNWALPAFETSVTEAILWAPAIAKQLGPASPSPRGRSRRRESPP